MRDISLIVVHTSDSPDDRDVDVREIRRWHLARGFRDVGYHYVIRKSGIVESGRPITQRGAHCQGHNTGSIGICWVGRRDCNPRQRRALISLIRTLMGQYGLKPDQVVGHCELDRKKTCPNIPMGELRLQLGA